MWCRFGPFARQRLASLARMSPQTLTKRAALFTTAAAALGAHHASCTPSQAYTASAQLPARSPDLYWLPLGEKWKTGLVTAFIENPTGATNKYEYDHETGLLKVDRVLHTAVYYPMDYGFIPRTLSEDGDALDICVLSFFPLLAGSIAEVRIIGVLIMEDEKGIDEKVLAVVNTDPRSGAIQDLNDIAPHKREEIAHFFKRYKDLEPGKWAKVGAWLDKVQAQRVLLECHERFMRSQNEQPKS